MAAGLQAFKEDGTQLFDTNYITYGLLKSGPLNFDRYWGFHVHRSAQLNPADESSYEYRLSTPDPICSITVYDSISPIVFVAGQGAPCGEITSGNAKTFFFRGVEPGARAYVFDLMRSLGSGAGMEVFNEYGQLTFTTDMPSLNIVQAITAPPPSPPYDGFPDIPNGPIYIGGGTYQRPKNWSESQPNELIGYIDIPHGHGDSAAYINFTRGCAYGNGSTNFIAGAQEGCGGGVNSVRFFFGFAAATTTRIAPNRSTTFWDIAYDRQPTALIIRCSDYPYPFN